jgi:hypothetical protein
MIGTIWVNTLRFIICIIIWNVIRGVRLNNVFINERILSEPVELFLCLLLWSIAYALLIKLFPDEVIDFHDHVESFS